MIVFIIILTALLALRSVLFIPGIIGHTWDWGVPNFPEQFKIQTEASLFIWDSRLYGGFFFPSRIELPYWLFTLIFSPLGGELLSKVIPLVILIIAGLSAFFTVRKVFSLNYFWALASAILYMLSPFAYSRLIAGHLTVLLGYAFLPLILYFSVSLFGSLSWNKGFRSWLPKLFLLSLTLTLGVLHPLILLVSWVVIFLTAGAFFIIGKGKRKNIIGKFFLALVFWALFASYWLLPILSQLIRGLEKLSIRPWQSVAEELGFRLPYLTLQSRPLSELFSFSFPFGLNTEFVYPLPDLIRPLFIFSSIVLFALTLVAAYLTVKGRRPYFPVIFMLTFIELIGLALVSGETTIVGRLIFFILIRFAPFIFSVFSNPLRFLPLVILPFSILPFLALAVIEEKANYLGKIILRGLIIFLLLVFFYPWFFGNLTTPIFKDQSQPMSLMVTKINPEDRKVFDYLRQFKEDFRIVHLPPPFVSWPGETDLSYIWNSIYSPKPLFVEYGQPELAGAIVNSLYSQRPSKDLSKLLGLGSVKTIIYPHYQQFAETYQTFVPGTADYKPFVDRNWLEQKDITKLSSPFSTVDLYENENFVPHIFVPTQVTFLEGERTSLTDIVSFPDYQIRNGVFFPEKEAEKTFLALDKTNNIYIKPSFIGGDALPQLRSEELYPVIRLLPTSPLYPLVRFKEGRLWKEMKDEPKLRANTALVLMAKRVNELKRMVELKEETQEAGVETVKRYQELLDDFSEQLDGLIERDEIENDFLIKAWIFFDDHNKNFNYIAQKTESPYIINGIKEIFGKMGQILAKIKSNIWITEDEREKKYLFTLPEEGDYSLFASPEIGNELNFELDGKLFTKKGELLDDQWVSLGKLSLDKGKHRLKVTLPKESNLFPGLATSSAVQKLSPAESPGYSYQFFAQKENEIITAYLTGLNDQEKYRVSFKFKVVGNPIRVTFEQANDEEVRGIIQHKIDVFLPMEDKWKKAKAIVSPNFGSHEAELKFYLAADKDETDTAFIEDIKIERVLIPNLLFKKEKKTGINQSPKITFRKINPTKYKVKVEEATNPYFLVFSETFNEGWKAYISDQQTVDSSQQYGEIIASYFDGQIKEGEHKNIFLDREIFANVFKKPIPEENHLLVNAFANTWYIDQVGDYEIILEFVPQRIYFLGLWISFIALVLILGSLGVLLIKQRA